MHKGARIMENCEIYDNRAPWQPWFSTFQIYLAIFVEGFVLFYLIC